MGDLWTPLYKTGRRPGVRPVGVKDLDEYSTAVLVPPPTFEVPDCPYPIDCNDRLGDCTIAGVSHLQEAWDKLFWETDRIPSEVEIEKTYFALTGGQDTGLQEYEVMLEWQRHGLFGEQIAAFAPVKLHILQLHIAVAFYGGAYLGIRVGRPQQEQFMKGEPWTYTGQEEEDGHCVVALGYGPHGGLHCATWGGIAVLTAGFLAHKLEEAWVAISHQLVERKKDSLGINLAVLQSNLARV